MSIERCDECCSYGGSHLADCSRLPLDWHHASDWRLVTPEEWYAAELRRMAERAPA